MVDVAVEPALQEESPLKVETQPSGNGVTHHETVADETNRVGAEAESPAIEAVEPAAAEPRAESDAIEPLQSQSNDEQPESSEATDASTPGEPTSINSPEKLTAQAPRREERRRLWFVRMPKPPDVASPADEPANLEVEQLNTTISFLNESLGVKRMERDRATEAMQGARAEFDAIRQQCDALKAVADPRRAERKQLRDMANTLQSEFKADYSDLPARSEEELASKISTLRQEMEHGAATSLAEEKKVLQHLRKLESLTQKVKEYSEKNAALREAQAAVKAAVQGSEETEADLTNLYEELSVQRAILDKYREEETRLKGEYKAAQDEKSRVWGQLQDLRGRIRAGKNEKYSRSRVWGDNRKFSQQIRLVLGKGEGALAEGKRLCNEQMDKAIEQLASDPDFCAEYFELWSMQRTHAVSAYEDVDDLSPQPGMDGHHGGAAAADMAAKDRAKKQIADILAQQAEAAKVRAAESARNTEEADKAAPAASSAAPDHGDLTADAAASAAAAAVGNAPAAAAGKKPQRRGSRSVATPAVVLPEVVDSPFELPSIAMKRMPATDANGGEDKQRIREQNRAAAAEAEKRKERQRKAGEEKRRAAEARRIKLEQEKAEAEKARLFAASEPPAASAAALSLEPDTPAAAASAVSDGSAAAADVASAAVAQGKQVVDEGAAKVKAAGSGAPKRVALQKEQPRARAPMRKRNAATKSLQKVSQKISIAVSAAIEQSWPWAQENAAVATLLGAGAALLLGILCMLILSR